MTTQGTYDDIDPSIVYLVESPLREEFEAHILRKSSNYTQSAFRRDDLGSYHTHSWLNLVWHGYHDRALQENLKLRDTPVMRELSDEEILNISEDFSYSISPEPFRKSLVNFARAILSAAKGNK